MTIYKIRHSIAWWHEVAQQEKLLTPGNILTLWSLFWASRASRRLKYVTKQHPLIKQKVRNSFFLRVFRTHTCSRLWICPWVCSTGELDQIRWRIRGVPPKEKIHWERGAKRGQGEEGRVWWEQINAETASAHFIHRSGNLTDKHLDGVWIWSTVVHIAHIATSLPVPRPLLTHRFHPELLLVRKKLRLARSSLFSSCSVWKCQILPSQTFESRVRIGSYWWKRWHNSLISSQPSKLLIQRIQTIGGYEARLTSHFWFTILPSGESWLKYFRFVFVDQSLFLYFDLEMVHIS